MRLMALFLLTAPALCWAQQGSTTITLTTGLDFGDFTVLGSCANCTITIDAATGNRTSSGGVILRPTNSGARASYDVQRAQCGNNCSYTVSVAPSTVTMPTAGGTMTVLSFTTSQTALQNRRNTLFVGGTLRIPSVSVTAGTYTSGNFTVTTVP